MSEVQTSYDRLAPEYAARIYGELAHKPFDRELLDRFAQQLAGKGPVCDLGCGPGHVARYLHERGVDTFGIDLSPAMVDEANRLNPGLAFRQGDILSLTDREGSWAGAAAFYSLIHFTAGQLATAAREVYRVLQPGGLLLVAFHVGREVRHLDELWGVPVDLDFRFFQPGEMTGCLEGAGFTIDESHEREPYPDVEAQTRRCYIRARKQVA